MRLRSRFDRQSPTPLACGIAIVLMLSGVFYFACEWSISMLVPRVSTNPPDQRVGSYLCIRSPGAPLKVIGVNAPAYRAALQDGSVPERDRVQVDVRISVRSEGAGDTSWSDVRLVTILHVEQNPDQRWASGVSMTPAEDLAVLRHIQRTNAKALPPALQGAQDLLVREWTLDGLLHNGLRLGALLIALGAGAFGIRRILRHEREYRRWALTHCPHCGYTLTGLPGKRCPECGRDRPALWRS